MGLYIYSHLDDAQGGAGTRLFATGSSTSRSSMRRSEILVSPFNAGYGPRAGKVKTLIGHSGGSIHSTASRLDARCSRTKFRLLNAMFPSRIGDD
jgi:hypothetical protein